MLVSGNASCIEDYFVDICPHSELHRLKESEKSPFFFWKRALIYLPIRHLGTSVREVFDF